MLNFCYDLISFINNNYYLRIDLTYLYSRFGQNGNPNKDLIVNLWPGVPIILPYRTQPLDSRQQLLGRICIRGNGWPDCNPNLSLGIPVISVCCTQPVDPSSAVTNMTRHHTTAHRMPGEQRTTPKNRLLHAAIEVVTMGRSSLFMY